MFSKVTSLLRPDSSAQTSPEENVARVAIDERGTIVYASKGFCSLSNRALDDLQNMPAEKLLSFFEIQAGHVPLEKVTPGVHKVYIGGHEDPFRFHFDWLQTSEGRKFLIGSESTEKKPSRAAMAQLTALIRSSAEQAPPLQDFTPEDQQHLLNLSHEAALILNDLGEILQTNTMFRQIFGYALEDLQGLHFLDLFEEHDRPFIKSTLEAFDFCEQPGNIQCLQDYEARILTKTGEVRWMLWRQALQGHKIYCSARDITDIRAQQSALCLHEKQLSEAESIARMGHWHWTIGTEHIQWSDEIYRIFGVERRHFQTTFDAMNKMVHRADIARLNQAFQRALIEENDYDMEFRIQTPAGETRYIRCEGRCSRDEVGEVTALYGIMQDMTERVLYEKELRKAKDNAEQAYAARTQFLANMSHELRTPLNAIIGFSEMIERQLLGPIGNQKYLEYIGGIRESGEHLLDLISDILDMSKIEAGKYELDLGEVQPGKLVRLAAHMMEGRAHEAKIKIVTDANIDETFKIIADRRAVLQVLLNLLSNAVKFSNEGGSVSVSLTETEGFCTLVVADNGIGIPAHKLASITKPFEQVSSSYARNHQGSGLGLAITKELVEMHGGSLLIESEFGKGTTVSIKMPKDAFKAAKPKKGGS